MKELSRIRFLLTLVFGTMSVSASANNVSFDAGVYTPDSSGQVALSILYDFTFYLMFRGGVNLVYDASALEFVSFTQDKFSGSFADPAFSPNGELTEAGLYQGFGIGTGDIFGGIGDSGSMGAFVFNVMGSGSGTFDGCVNGATMCLTPHLPFDPMISLAGQDVTDAIFSNEDGLNANLVVPLPASVWFFFSGLLALLKFGRTSASSYETVM